MFICGDGTGFHMKFGYEKLSEKTYIFDIFLIKNELFENFLISF